MQAWIRGGSGCSSSCRRRRRAGTYVCRSWRWAPAGASSCAPTCRRAVNTHYLSSILWPTTCSLQLASATHVCTDESVHFYIRESVMSWMSWKCWRICPITLTLLAHEVRSYESRTPGMRCHHFEPRCRLCGRPVTCSPWHGVAGPARVRVPHGRAARSARRAGLRREPAAGTLAAPAYPLAHSALSSLL